MEMEDEEKFRILAVDDQKTNLVMLSTILSKEYSVSTADNGTEALERARENLPDLILLDILLPDINGFEVLKRLKEAPETMGIPVIIISGLTSAVDEEKGLLMGAVDYITKPFKEAIVLARVKAHLQIVQQMRTIGRLGLMDPLTNIPNRRCFDDRFSVEWRRTVRMGGSISFLMMDIDKFKEYNDTWGHPQGDALLKGAALIFAAAARRPGDLIARLGGEEFGLLLPDTGIDAAVRVAEEIRRHIEQMTVPTADGVETRTTISIGAASCCPDQNAQMDDFILAADKNLYRAKDMGRNRVCF
jgi:diguanylate cyclase (GGDEF)-like protein